MRNSVILGVLTAMGAVACSGHAAIINVPGDQPHLFAAVSVAVNGDEIVLADGVYTGANNKNIVFGGKLITIRSASGDPSLCTIDLEGSGRAFLINLGETAAAIVDGITISNGDVPFDFGGGIYIQSASPTIRNCIFDNCNAGFDGGGVWVLNGVPSITDCMFKSCFATDFGAGLYVLNDDPVITDCTFIDNLAITGGGMYLLDCDSVVTGCRFESNEARDDGGAVYSALGAPSFDDCDVLGNFTNDGVGGGFLLDGSNALVTNCTFNNNSAGGAFPIGSGGGIVCFNNTTCIEDCDFDGNTADDRGGALFMDLNADVDVVNCTFTNSVAYRGGAIDVFTAVLNLADSYFEANSTNPGDGGAIRALGGDILAYGSTFYNNFADFRGGAISQSGAAGGATCEIIDCTFVGNQSDDSGGAVSSWDTGGNTTTVVNSIFSGNTALVEAGGLFCFGGNVDLTVDNCSFTNNTSTSGGAINTFYFDPDAKIYNTICWNNTPDEIFGTLTTTVSWCDVDGGVDASVTDGGGNIDADPFFADADGADNTIGTPDDDLRLIGGSPCIDAGNNSLIPPSITTDLDGNARRANDPATADTGIGNPPIVDMGAYEVPGTCLGDLNNDGEVNAADLAILLGAWGRYGPCPPYIVADLDQNCDVNAADLATLLGAWGPCPPPSTPILYSISPEEDLLREISTADASTLSMVTLVLDGGTAVGGGTGLATDPTSGILYAVLKLSGGRVLATIDNFTGDATTVGTLSGESFAGIAFSCDGTLYGVTGDGSNTPESLFEIDKTDATITFVLTLGIGDDGEMIGYNPEDGLLYHGSGHDGDAFVFFESIDPCTLDVTNIDISTTALVDEETQALTWWAGSSTFLWKQNHGSGPLYSVSADASTVILIGTMDHQCKGLAFLFDGVVPCDDRCTK